MGNLNIHLIVTCPESDRERVVGNVMEWDSGMHDNNCSQFLCFIRLRVAAQCMESNMESTGKRKRAKGVEIRVG